MFEGKLLIFNITELFNFCQLNINKNVKYLQFFCSENTTKLRLMGKIKL